MNSNDLKQFLISDQRVQKIVAGRFDMEDEELDTTELAYIQETVANSKNPKKWKRMNKFTVGGKADEIFGTHYPEWIGGTAREFWLEGTDHITIILIVKDNTIVGIEDFSD